MLNSIIKTKVSWTKQLLLTSTEKLAGRNNVPFNQIVRKSSFLTKCQINILSETHTGGIIQSIIKREFKTSEQKNAIPPTILVALSRVAKFGAVFAGRSVRIWWKKLTPEERAKYSTRISRNRYILSGILGGLAFGSFVYYETHLQETPFTKRKRFVVFTDKQFDEMSKYELQMMLELYKSKIIHASLNLPSYRRVVDVAQRLLKANQDLPTIHDKNWTITVVDDEGSANAFVLPCGSIFVFTGLLKLCGSDDELGIILGHEMAHAVMGHGAEKASFLHFLDLVMILPLAALWAILPTDLIAGFGHFVTSTITKLVMELPHSRFVEHEADQVGLILAAKACFDVRHSLMLWEKMSLLGSLSALEDELNLEWLSTHPSHDKRQSQLEELLPEALNVRDKCLCPKLPFYDAKAEILKFEQNLKKNQKNNPHEGLLMPVRIH